jgi:uncharacterized membrane protein YphA (DoxX/SURF4 family)
MKNNNFLLRLALAFTLLFAGIDSFVHTSDWIWFVPTWLENFGISQQLALHGHAVMEIILGILLLTGWKTRWVAAVVAADMVAIIFANGLSRELFLITFRDVGLFFVALHLALYSDNSKLNTSDVLPR